MFPVIYWVAAAGVSAAVAFYNARKEAEKINFQGVEEEIAKIFSSSDVDLVGSFEFLNRFFFNPDFVTLPEYIANFALSLIGAGIFFLVMVIIGVNAFQFFSSGAHGSNFRGVALNTLLSALFTMGLFSLEGSKKHLVDSGENLNSYMVIEGITNAFYFGQRVADLLTYNLVFGPNLIHPGTQDFDFFPSGVYGSDNGEGGRNFHGETGELKMTPYISLEEPVDGFVISGLAIQMLSKQNEAAGKVLGEGKNKDMKDALSEGAKMSGAINRQLNATIINSYFDLSKDLHELAIKSANFDLTPLSKEDGQQKYRIKTAKIDGGRVSIVEKEISVPLDGKKKIKEVIAMGGSDPIKEIEDTYNKAVDNYTSAIKSLIIGLTPQSTGTPVFDVPVNERKMEIIKRLKQDSFSYINKVTEQINKVKTYAESEMDPNSIDNPMATKELGLLEENLHSLFASVVGLDVSQISVNNIKAGNTEENPLTFAEAVKVAQTPAGGNPEATLGSVLRDFSATVVDEANLINSGKMVVLGSNTFSQMFDCVNGYTRHTMGSVMGGVKSINFNIEKQCREPLLNNGAEIVRIANSTITRLSKNIKDGDIQDGAEGSWGEITLGDVLAKSFGRTVKEDKDGNETPTPLGLRLSPNYDFHWTDLGIFYSGFRHYMLYGNVLYHQNVAGVLRGKLNDEVAMDFLGYSNISGENSVKKQVSAMEIDGKIDRLAATAGAAVAGSSFVSVLATLFSAIGVATASSASLAMIFGPVGAGVVGKAIITLLSAATSIFIIYAGLYIIHFVLPMAIWFVAVLNWFVKSSVMVITFPISIVLFLFQEKRQNFVPNIWAIAGQAIVPVVMVALFFLIINTSIIVEMLAREMVPVLNPAFISMTVLQLLGFGGSPQEVAQGIIDTYKAAIATDFIEDGGMFEKEVVAPVKKYMAIKYEQLVKVLITITMIIGEILFLVFSTLFNLLLLRFFFYADNFVNELIGTGVRNDMINPEQALRTFGMARFGAGAI